MSLVILDRDGVINHDSPDYIKSLAEWHPIEGSLAAIATLSRHHHRVYIATNQSGIARKLFTQATLTTIHQTLQTEVEGLGGKIDGIFYCPHHPNQHCHCRKPKPGLLEQIAKHAGQSIAGSPLIGDSLTDLLLAVNNDCTPILVRTGKGAETYKQLKTHPILSKCHIPCFNNLADATKAILANQLSP